MKNAFRPDIEVGTADGTLAVEIKERIKPKDERYFADLLLQWSAERSKHRPTYSLLVDSELMRFYDVQSSGEPLTKLRTREVLKKYDVGIDEQIVYHSYLETLVQVWLNELSITPRAEIAPEIRSLPPRLLGVLNPA